jgi:demethoxyubiquinone hydroxylase (CLK1/Coq7/Cat5 family)
MLPVERKKHLEGQTATPEEIKKEQEEIHSKVVKRRDDELERDEAAIDLVRFVFNQFKRISHLYSSDKTTGF